MDIDLNKLEIHYDQAIIFSLARQHLTKDEIASCNAGNQSYSAHVGRMLKLLKQKESKPIRRYNSIQCEECSEQDACSSFKFGKSQEVDIIASKYDNMEFDVLLFKCPNLKKKVESGE